MELWRVPAYFAMSAAPNSPLRTNPEDQGHRFAKGGRWGSFEILALVGRGSFGEVYRAWDPALQREVGLKILLPRSIGGDALLEDLLREARALASVRHPNIVPVYGVDQQDGLIGFWTDFVHGKTLAQLVRQQGPFGYREAALVGLDVAKALSAVHRAGLLHRDIKAENVMREEGGRILLMDFGLSALPHLQQDLAGTPRYMAPELFSGAAATVASDIYAIGVLLFYLVAGEFPALHTAAGAAPRPELGGDEVTAEASGLAGFLPRPPAATGSASRSVVDFRPDLHQGFARIIDTAIHPDPLKRFSSAGALSTALSEVLAAPFAGDVPAQVQVEGKKRRSWGRYAAGLAVFLVLASGTLTYLRHGRAFSGLVKSHDAALDASENLNDKYLKADSLLLRYDRRKNVTDAIGLLKEVLAQDPNFALAQAGLGRAYFLQYRATRTPGQLDQARAACNRAIGIDPSLAPPYVTLARIDAMAGNTALATQEAQKALQLDPRSAEAYGAQAEVFDAQGRSADAIASVQRAIDLAPDYWRWPVLLGSYYFASGKLKEAADQFRKAATIDSNNATALYDLGLVSLQLERLEDARINLEKSAQIEPSFAVYSSLAELLATEGQLAESVEMRKKALNLNSTNYIAWGNLASGYLWSPGGHDKAMEAYRKAIELAEASRKDTPEDPQLLARLGGYYAAIGQSTQSLPLLRQAVALAPDDPNVLFTAGEGYEILHHRGDAIHMIAKSLARGYHASQLQRSPELAGLRANGKFQEALRAEQAKISLDTARKTR
jgi:tetratricopeptide (TPR) repeat protein